VTATATLSSGQSLNLTATALKAHIWSDAVGKPRANATVKWCQGEVDYPSVIKPQKWAFGEVDYTATPATGSAAWPANHSILLAPYGADTHSESRAASGGVYSKEFVVGNSPGDYEPHCVQRVFMKAAGSGKLFLGAANSTGASAFTAWSKEVYGFTFNLPNKAGDPSIVTVTNCASTITPLGHSLGAPSSKWVTTSSPLSCLVGVPEAQEKPFT
jgi:hypothetical protein